MALQSLATDTRKIGGITLDKYDFKHVVNKVTSRIILIIILTQSSKIQEMPHNYTQLPAGSFKFINLPIIMPLKYSYTNSNFIPKPQ